jgi:DNA modification methylase
MSKLHSIFSNYNKSDFPIVTHNIHPYPAKYPPHIPNLILNNYAKNKEITVMDPFMGSGTTVVESNFLGYHCIGNDINPLSPYLVKCKMTRLTKEDLDVLSLLEKEVLEKYGQKPEVPLVNWKGIEKWFKTHILYELCLIKSIITSPTYAHLDWFTKICLSSIVVSVSNQDNDIRYCTHIKTANDTEGYAVKQFLSKLKKYLKDNQLLDTSYNNYKLINNNALDLVDVDNDSIDLIITSPPYANTNDYFLNHRLRLLLLDMDYDYYRNNEIGSHAQYSSKKANISVWNFDLLKMLQSFQRVLKPNADAFIVIGDSVWQRDLYKIDKIVEEHCKELNFAFKDIYSYNLKAISRSFNPTFADPNHSKQEHIIHIQKV